MSFNVSRHSVHLQHFGIYFCAFFFAFLQVFCTDGNIFLLFKVLLVHFKDFVNDFYTVIRFSELFVIVGRFLSF